MSEVTTTALPETGRVRVVASKSTWIESAAVDQLKKTALLPGIELAVGLPDLHPGKGSPIGAAFVSNGWIYPALVGNDIGCGIALWRTELTAGELQVRKWADRLHGLDDAWEGDPGAYLAARRIEPSGHDASLGTIGGGNHFAELQKVERIESPEQCEALGVDCHALYLCVHSGSRGLGESILRGHTSERGASGLLIAEAGAYLDRHRHASAWASVNRELIAARMLARLRCEGRRLLDVCHNGVEERLGPGAELPVWIHRKGAAPSTAGPVVIPGSRGAFSYLVMPLPDAAENCAWSIAHGAGRKWSRSDSRGRLEKRYTAKDLERTSLGNQVICEDRQLLYEEAPQAYKDITTVIADLVNARLIEILAILRPVLTYKVRR